MRILLLSSVVILVLHGCGGGGGSDGGDNNPDPVIYNCSGSGSVTINGTLTFDRVPAMSRLDGSVYLDYDATTALPIRQAKVEAICPDGSLAYATDYSNEFGQYTLDVPENVDVVVRVQAVMNDSTAPGWDVEVRDDTDGNRIWGMSGDEFESGSSDLTVDLHAASGWNGSSYASERTAGPFAILDTVLDAMSVIRAVDPAAHFPPLDVYWSNDTEGTYYNGNGGIYVLGAANFDTDEYDAAVIAHEWGHYFEDKFSRSDSIGGQHSGDDKLDMRVAFGEGFGNAWSGIATGDTVYRDTNSTAQGSGFRLGLENDADSSFPQSEEGWFNETSIQRIVFDLYDSDSDVLDDDAISLGFEPLYQVLTTTQKQSPYLTSLFPLIAGLKANPLVNDAAVDALLVAAEIEPVNNAKGDGEDNDAGLTTDRVLPIYTSLPANGNIVNICSTNAGRSTYGPGEISEYNKLGARRFLDVNITVSDQYKIEVSGPADSDPDFVLHNKGSVQLSQAEGTTETLTVTLNAPATYVIEVYDYYNIDDEAATGDDVCFDVSITPVP